MVVPAGWDLSAYHGNLEEGYACLDDGVETRLQVRWSPAGKRRPDLDLVLQQYQRVLSKAAKGRIEFDSPRGTLLPRAVRETRDSVPFSWQADCSAHGMAWYCRSCKRVVIVEVRFPLGAVDRSLARRILKSAVDHRDDGQRLWSVYGFAFVAPAAYNLHQPHLMPGRLQFLLRASKRAWLRVERWAVASQWMRKVSLDQWPDEMLKAMRLTQRAPLTRAEAEIRGHPARRFTAVVAGRGLFRREQVKGVVWCCPADDKVFVVMASGGEDGLADHVAGAIRCG